MKDKFTENKQEIQEKRQRITCKTAVKNGRYYILTSRQKIRHLWIYLTHYLRVSVKLNIFCHLSRFHIQYLWPSNNTSQKVTHTYQNGRTILFHVKNSRRKELNGIILNCSCNTLSRNAFIR